MTSKHPASTSLYRQITVWVVGTLLLLQLLAVVTTWHCSDTSQASSGSSSSAIHHLLWLPHHSLCKESSSLEENPFVGQSGSRSKVRVQRPYAVAFCLTSIHHLCTALINVVRLRKLHTSQVRSQAQHLSIHVTMSKSKCKD